MKPCESAYFGWKTLGFLLLVFLYVSVLWLMLKLKFMLPAVVYQRSFPAGLWLEQLEAHLSDYTVAIKKRIVNKVSSLLKNKEIQLFGGPNFLFVPFLVFLLINFHHFFS